jgi:hypothetical protein
MKRLNSPDYKANKHNKDETVARKPKTIVKKLKTIMKQSEVILMKPKTTVSVSEL